MKFKLLILFLIPLFSFGQKTTRFFIDKNFGLDVDTNEFKLTDKYSNTSWLTNSYTFNYFLDDSNYIHILTLEEKLPFRCSDSITKEYTTKILDKMGNLSNDSINLFLGDIIKYNSYYYFIGKGGLKTEPNNIGSSLWGFRCYNNMMMKINCFSGNNSKMPDNELERVFKKFSDGVTYYTDLEVEKADSLILLELTPKFKIRNREIWEGEIWIETKKPLIIKEVALSVEGAGYHMVFHPDNTGKTIFSFEPAHRGLKQQIPTGQGYFILKNSLGKDVKLEFDFSKEFRQ